jgi:sulfatase maturation enzyme AslB (radical SAM superfamily)
MVKGAHNRVTKDDGTTYTCQDNFVEDSWNSNYMKNLRLDMAAGKSITGCDVCYKQEANGRTSNREHSIREWNWRLGEENLTKLIQDSILANGHVDSPPVYLDLRLGNLCNLKCRMCNPWNSSQIVKEHQEMADSNPEYTVVWEKTFGKFPVNVMDNQTWFDHDMMWDQIIGLIPSLKKVYMTGGEPTLIKNNFKFMEECIAQGRTDIVLFFNTNCTNVNRRFLELVSQFDTVNINASLDGTGIVNDYIRAPSNWEQISSNVEKLANLKNVTLGITPTVQIYNMFNIVSLMKWVDELRSKYNKDIFIDFLINHHPHHLSTSIVSKELRDQAIQEIFDFKANGLKSYNQMTMNSLNGLLGHLNGETSHDSQEQLNRFKTYTLALDNQRGQDINCLDPRIAQLTK